MSKVALNIAGKTLAGDLKQSLGGSVALVHPGVVRPLLMPSMKCFKEHFLLVIATVAHCDAPQLFGVALRQCMKQLQCLLEFVSMSCAVLMQVNTNMLRSLRKARGVAEDKLSANTLSPEESASRILKLIDNLSLENSGKFWAADTGKIIGW